MASTIADRTVINGDDGSPGFGVYLHWPFCAAKCPYCDFNSHVRHSAPDQQAFARAFATEAASMRARTGPRTVTSIFIGGGTPSLMEPSTVGTILDAVAKNWTVPSDIEITMEANPASVDASRFTGYRAHGVNRLSLGVQALNDTDLKFLVRLHTTEEAINAITLARDTFPRLSFDLIYARPSQSPEAWEEELLQAIDLAADHLSLYQLTIEDGTPFKALHQAGKLMVPGEDHAAKLYEITEQITSVHGLPCYEISNYARPGAQSRHNLTYWRYGDYVGLGPGAHGRFTDESGARFATAAERHPETWLEKVTSNGHGTGEHELLSPKERGNEMLLMGLRLVEGLDLPRLANIAGQELDQGRLQSLIDLRMIERVGNDRIRATAHGRLLLNSLIGELAF